MAEIHTAHTADLDAAILSAARALLYDVFDDMTDPDREHARGGVHALGPEGAELTGHASVIQRRLLNRGPALRTGYAEAVGVRADRRGRGYGAAIMDTLERVVRGACELGAPGATGTAAAFYAARGWTRAPSSRAAADVQNAQLKAAETDTGPNDLRARTRILAHWSQTSRDR